MVVGTEEKQQVNILEQTRQLKVIVGDLDDRLANRFNRAPQPTAGETKQEHSNVLDEIIENLQVAMFQLNQITSCLQTDVLPKIS